MPSVQSESTVSACHLFPVLFKTLSAASLPVKMDMGTPAGL